MKSFRVVVIVRMREDLPEPQGMALEKVLKRMGYEGITGIRVGKVIEMFVRGEGREEVEKTVNELSRTLFSNPVIEDYEVRVEEL